MKKIFLFILILITIIIFICIYSNYENNKLQVSSYHIINSKITNSFNDFKIIQISDLHNANSKKLIKKIINETKKEEPNLIVITGDFIDSRNPNIDIAMNLIKEIKDIAPIFFVPGNHEASSDKYEELKERLIENNVTILENKISNFIRNDEQINIIGLSDPAMKNNPYETDEEIINSELESFDYNKDNFTILLSHRPELFNIYTENKIDLVLSGHAHGGQIRIPFVGGLVAPNQGLFPKFTSGEIKVYDTTMIISRGIGNSIIPIRVNNPPELVSIKLKNN